MTQSNCPAVVGMFDSGVGGLSVLRALRSLMPSQPVIYLADQAHVPYGPRPLEEVRSFSTEITRFLTSRGAKIIVVACNSASAAALHHLRRTFPDLPFVGMEPAVKPAAEHSHSRRVGVLATPATFQGKLYASVVERFASDVRLYPDACPGLVAEIEAGRLDADQTRAILERALQPMLAEGIDTVVLGCTHYPFVIPLIEDIAGPGVRVIDPAPAVARQTMRLLEERNLVCQDGPPAEVEFYTTGNPAPMEDLIQRWLGISAEVHPVEWQHGVVRPSSDPRIPPDGN